MNLPNPSGRTRPLGFTQPLTEMSTREKKIFIRSRTRHEADNLRANCLDIVESSTSHNPMGLHGPLRRQLKALATPTYYVGDHTQLEVTRRLTLAEICFVRLTAGDKEIDISRNVFCEDECR
jgi:hypothetical protein